MKITIDIPKNDYKQPNEIREDVVQKICDYIIKKMNQGTWIEDSFQLELEHNRWTYQLYIEIKSDGSIYQFWSENRKSLNLVRVRKCEMEAVFEMLQDGGYYIYGTAYTNGEKVYTFSKKPFYDNRAATKMSFFEFID